MKFISYVQYRIRIVSYRITLLQRNGLRCYGQVLRKGENK